MGESNFDISEIKEAFSELGYKISNYLSSLNQNEKIGWILIGSGVILLIVGTILL